MAVHPPGIPAIFSCAIQRGIIHGNVQADGRALLTMAVERLKLSGRDYHRVLRVARTLADLAGEDKVRKSHIAEAVAYRRPVVGQ